MQETTKYSLVIIVVLLVAGMGFIGFNNITGAAVATGDKLVLARTVAPASTLAYIAEEKGYWKQADLDVEIETVSSGKAGFEAMISDKVDMTTVAEVPLVIAALKNQDFIILDTIAESAPYSVIARRDFGITRIADLKNKKVASKTGTGSEYFMYTFLKENNLSRSEVEVISIDPQYAAGALIKGDVAAMFFWEPHPYYAQKSLGNNAITFRGTYGEIFNIVGKREFVEKNPEKIKKFLTGLLLAEEFLRKNKEEAIEIVAKKVNMDKNDLGELWANYRFRNGLNSELITQMNEEAKWAIETGKVESRTIPDYRKYIFEKPLMELQPSSVKLN